MRVPSKRISSYQCPVCVRHAQAGSLVWTKASHQSSTESHAWGGNEPCEAGGMEVSGNNASSPC